MVKALVLETGVAPTSALAEALQRRADWHATPQVRLEACDPKGFRRVLQGALRARQLT